MRRHMIQPKKLDIHTFDSGGLVFVVWFFLTFFGVKIVNCVNTFAASKTVFSPLRQNVGSSEHSVQSYTCFMWSNN